MTRALLPRRIAVGLSAGMVLTAACLAASAPARAQVMVLAPPAPVYEVAPAPRVGYAWRAGHYRWIYGRYEWVPGHWIEVARGRPMPPPPPEPVAQVMRLSADALFAFDRGDIGDVLPGGRADIREIAARLNASHVGHLEVRGYTDRLGNPQYNLALSQRRAEAVKALLVEQGIPADRIDARGYGEQDPVSHCAGNRQNDALVACLQPDRRVEIVSYARGPRRDGPPPAPPVE